VGDQTEQLIRLPRVMELTGRSKAAIYADETFPKPIKLGSGGVGRASAWVLSEVNFWIHQRIRESRRQPVEQVAS
jgi:prophage regulatory protein